MATELKSHRVAAVAITRLSRSEAMLEHYGVTEENWRDGAEKTATSSNRKPLFVGRAVAALAADRNVLARSGHVWSSWELARHYGFTDVDGRRPDWGSFKPDFSEHPAWLMELLNTGIRLQLEWLTELAGRTKRYIANWTKPVAKR
jgi:hypothetical protein